MNKCTILLRCLLMGFIMLLSFISYGQQEVVGSWLVDWNMTKEKMPSSEKSSYDNLSQPAKDRLITTFSQRQFNFNTDGTVDISYPLGGEIKKVSGTWIFQPDNSTLEIQTSQYTSKYSVVWLSDTQLQLTNLDNENKGLIKILVLKK